MGDWTGSSKANVRQVSGEGYKHSSSEEEALRREELAQEREDRAEEQVRKRAETLAQRLAETYTELTKLMRENPGLKREAETPDEVRQHAIYQKLRTNLQHAKLSPRCRWVKQDGTTCGSPQMRNHIYCYSHRQMMEARTLMLRLPAAEDANAIQVGIMKVQKALIEDMISTKKAGLLLYSMQLAIKNVGQTTFGKARDEEMITDGVDEMDGLAEQMAEAMPEPVRSREMPGLKEYEDRIAGARAGLPRDADEHGFEKISPRRHRGTEEMGKDLPRINADERGPENGSGSRKEMQRAVHETGRVGHPGSSARQTGMDWEQMG